MSCSWEVLLDVVIVLYISRLCFCAVWSLYVLVAMSILTSIPHFVLCIHEIRLVFRRSMSYK